MRQEESFLSFIQRTIITFWAFVTLGIMLLVTSVSLAYIGTIVYKHLTRDQKIIIVSPRV